MKPFLSLFLLNRELFILKELFHPLNKLILMLLEGFLQLFVLFISLEVVFVEIERDADVNFGYSEFAELFGDIDLRWVFLVEIDVEVLLLDDRADITEIGAEL